MATRDAGPWAQVMLRADIDALPIREETPFPQYGASFASQTAGAAHLCGHDGHTSMLLGAARMLKAREKDLAGTVRRREVRRSLCRDL